MVTADHGPAVAGAHNTIVAARAGKDLISALCSGLLTIGPRFGGALDGAAQQFSAGYDSGLAAEDFMTKMRRDKELIMGIGHKIKSLENPDVRVVIIKEFAKKHFATTEVLDFALAVEQCKNKTKTQKTETTHFDTARESEAVVRLLGVYGIVFLVSDSSAVTLYLPFLFSPLFSDHQEEVQPYSECRRLHRRLLRRLTPLVWCLHTG